MDSQNILEGARRLVDRTQWRPVIEADFYPRIIVDWNGRIAMVNSLAAELFNYPEEMLMGHLVEEFMPERFRARHVGFRTKYFDNPTRRSMGSGIELAILTRTGLEVRVDLGLAPLRVPEGTFVSITIQRRAEA
jgi:PAS domain S-box-containing protein